MSGIAHARPKPKVVCLDVDGTLVDGLDGPPLPGALAAVAALRERVPVRFVTNAGVVTRATVASRLRGHGFLRDDAELYTPSLVARALLRERGHDGGILLGDAAARADWEWFRDDPEGPAVVVASEGWGLRIEELQAPFRRLLDGAAFYALHRTRYFRVGDSLKTDLGPLVAFLACASRREAESLGKPSAALFDRIATDAGVRRDELLMLGDDAEFDASGAVALGMHGALVRTGKYRKGDEARVDPRPAFVFETLADLLVAGVC